MLFKSLKKYSILVLQARNLPFCSPVQKPQHLICFQQWTSTMVAQILKSALNLKCMYRDTHNLKLNILENSKIMILQEVNEPVLNMAVSKAASFLGATDVSINDQIVWDHDYNGGIFGLMADAIFVSTTTHMCVARFARKSPVPVLCMRSRTHATIQSLATIMAIMEEYGTMKNVKIAWLGAPHPILNSYLLLCPMLGANIRFKCCCKECPVSPLLLKASEDMTKKSSTEVKECPETKECLRDALVFISGPKCCKKEKIAEFSLSVKDLQQSTTQPWIYFNTCPRGEEVSDELFYHCSSRTFDAFQNMQYIAAALMAYCIRKFTF